MSGNEGPVLLIIAHPDDECMFFLPTIIHFQRANRPIHILCLTTGNADGLGNIRTQELLHSCSLLGIPSTRVIIIDDPCIPDSMTIQWPIDHVAAHINKAITTIQPSTVVTFDAYGVSYHINHISTSLAVQYTLSPLSHIYHRKPLHKEQQQPMIDNNTTELYLLQTTSLMRKFISFFDIFISLIIAFVMYRRRLRCCIGGGPVVGWKALSAHHSQFVWYRKLFILFSSYLYVNTLKKVKISSSL